MLQYRKQCISCFCTERGSDFLILDEATSSLDNMTAKAIFDSIFNLKGTSCIIITHQLDDDVLDKCDCIYVMKNGQLMLSFFEDNSK